MFVIVSITKRLTRRGKPTVHTYGPFHSENVARYQVSKHLRENPHVVNEIDFSVCRVLGADD